MQHFIKVDDENIIAFKEYGNLSGVPVVMLHGGPGGSINTKMIDMIDLSFYRLIAIDQRGCGLSKPMGVIKNNSTQNVIKDIEVVREFLNIDNWILFGRSWGTALAMLYAQKYPQNCICIIVRGIFLGRCKDEEWTFNGSKSIFPKQWQEFTSLFTDKNRLNFQIYNILFGNDDSLAAEVNSKMMTYMDILTTNNINTPVVKSSIENILFSKIFLHYSINKYFLEQNQILDNMKLCSDIKGYIIHGEKDNDCKVEQAIELHNKWENSTLIIKENSTHDDDDSDIKDAIKHIFIDIKKMLLLN